MMDFSRLPDEQIRQLNKRIMEDATAEHAEFSEKFNKGICYLCDAPIESITYDQTCMHWLLRPKGVDKIHVLTVLKEFDYHRIQPFLRWIANKDRLLKNINDLVEEKSSDKIIENTITFKNLEWSFSSSKNDFAGIPDSKHGSVPHYHFQMRIGGKPFFDYSDFHIPFTEYDLRVFAVQLGEYKGLRHTYGHGMGMQGALDEITEEQLMSGMTSVTNESEATFRLSTMIEAEEGSYISGDELANIVEESKRTGKPLAELMKKLEGVKITTVVSPGPGVPDIAARKGGRKRKKK
jgi:hypothetical protein